MKILWVTINRENRVATIFDPLREEVSKIAEVDVIMKQLPMLASAYQNSNIRLKEKYLVNPKKANEYDWVFTDAPFAFQNEQWSKIKTKKAVLFEDQHGHNPVFSRLFKDMGFDLFFSRYGNLISRHSHLNNSRIILLPHSIDDKIFKDYKFKKKIDTLMVGVVEQKNYPIRYAIDKQLKGQKFYRRIFRPVETQGKKKKWPTGISYAKLLNSAKITFTCSSIFKYNVLKFFEIPGAKSALFSDYNNELKKLGFIPNENMVEIKKGMKYIDFIKGWLESKNQLEEITQKGYDLVHKKHTAKIRAEEFVNHLDSK